MFISTPPWTYSAPNCGVFTYSFSVNPAFTGITKINDGLMKVYSNEATQLGLFKVTITGTLLNLFSLSNNFDLRIID